MLHDTKPPLDGDLLIHYGVPGMKWGQRRNRDSGGSSKISSSKSSQPKSKSSNAKKVAFGVAAVAGAVAVGLLLAKSGNVKISAGGLTNPNSKLYNTMTAGKKAASYTTKNKAAMATPMKALPAGRKLAANPVISQAMKRSASATNATRAATSATRASTRAARVTSAAKRAGFDLGDLNAVRDAMNDPNFVWEF